MNGKHFVVAILVSSILLTLAFSSASTQQTRTYDPWLDYNDDGRIDARDITATILAFGTKGDPAKPVMVTYSTNDTYKIVYLEPWHSSDIIIPTKGFRYIVIGISVRYNSTYMVFPSPILNVKIYFQLHQVPSGDNIIYLGPRLISVENFNVTATPGGEFVLTSFYDTFKTYQIQGIQIEILLTNLSKTYKYGVVIGVYMTA